MAGRDERVTPELGSESPDLLITADLLREAKDGDTAALNALMGRYLPRLYRWACGRLPAHARSLFDTSDLVQEALLKTLQSLDHIEVRGPGGFQAYVRQTIRNRIKDQVRWAARRAGSVEALESMPDTGLAPLERLVGTDLLERYEKACTQLSEEEQLFLHLRIELELRYEEIAEVMQRPSSDAARMAVQRAMRKLAEIMGHER